MKRVLAILICILMVTGLTACSSADKEKETILLDISARDVDVQYMEGTDLTVFGSAAPHKLDEHGTLILEFAEFESFESEENLFLVNGTGELGIYGQKYSFTIGDEIMSKVHVSESNTVYESILSASAVIGGRDVELSIDFVASEDFSQAVATVSAGNGMLFFGDIFNDYLEYFNMILAGAVNE